MVGQALPADGFVRYDPTYIIVVSQSGTADRFRVYNGLSPKLGEICGRCLSVWFSARDERQMGRGLPVQ